MEFWTESRRDQEEGGELDFHEELDNHLRVSPGEIKRREVVLDPQVSPGEFKSREVELDSESWTTFLLQLFLNSRATDILLVLTAISGVHQLLRTGEDRSPLP